MGLTEFAERITEYHSLLVESLSDIKNDLRFKPYDDMGKISLYENYSIGYSDALRRTVKDKEEFEYFVLKFNGYDIKDLIKTVEYNYGKEDVTVRRGKPGFDVLTLHIMRDDLNQNESGMKVGLSQACADIFKDNFDEHKEKIMKIYNHINNSFNTGIEIYNKNKMYTELLNKVNKPRKEKRKLEKKLENLYDKKDKAVSEREELSNNYKEQELSYNDLEKELNSIPESNKEERNNIKQEMSRFKSRMIRTNAKIEKLDNGILSEINFYKEDDL